MLESQDIKSCIRKSENNEKKKTAQTLELERKFQIDISLRIV